jgi:hypothetical protein
VLSSRIKTERDSPGAGSGNGAQPLAERIPIYETGLAFNLFVSALPYRKGKRQQVAGFVGKDEDAAPAVVRILLDFDQAAALKRLQRRGQGSPIHRKQGSDRPHRRRLGTIERHKQGELAVCKFKGAQFFIEAPGQGACCALHMEAETSILHYQRCLVRQRFCT